MLKACFHHLEMFNKFILDHLRPAGDLEELVGDMPQGTAPGSLSSFREQLRRHPHQEDTRPFISSLASCLLPLEPSSQLIKKLLVFFLIILSPLTLGSVSSHRSFAHFLMCIP